MMTLSTLLLPPKRVLDGCATLARSSLRLPPATISLPLAQRPDQPYALLSLTVKNRNARPLMLVQLIQQHASCASYTWGPVLQTSVPRPSCRIVVILFEAPPCKGVLTEKVVISLSVINSRWLLIPRMSTAKSWLQDRPPNDKPAGMEITGQQRILNCPQICLPLVSCSLLGCSLTKNLPCRRFPKSEKYPKRSRNPKKTKFRCDEHHFNQFFGFPVSQC
jgi:hypothetical protein